MSGRRFIAAGRLGAPSLCRSGLERVNSFCSPHGNDKVALQHQTHRELVYRPFQFQKCGEDFFGTDDKTLSVAMRVNNPNCSPVGIHGMSLIP
jgi:hypothetical protein